MTPVETLCQQAEWIYLQPDHLWLRDGRPGEAFASLPEATKEVLRRLKSDDLRNVRLDAVLPVVAYCQSRGEWARKRRRPAL